jgi:CRISPR/Cas system-associated exonuclease Cas4 (RecB family)
MRTFSKSKILAYRQCPKRLWLEVHQPELREDSTATQASFQIGFQVGDVAHRIYDEDGKGALIDVQSEGFSTAFARSADLLNTPQPIFEAGFSAGGALAFADVMLPVDCDGVLAWRMVEVKSSTSVKDYHRDDAAVQAFVARSAGVPLLSIALAHIDSSWVYPGNKSYQGLLKEKDLTAEAFARADEVKGWISDAQKVVNEMTAPAIAIGDHCNSPYECGFYAYCSKDEPKAEFPLNWLPRFSAAKIKELAGQGINDLRNTPDNLLNSKQQLVKDCTLSNKIFFDAEGAAADLARYPLPAYFLDFESIQFAVPIWKSTRPYQQITFQFSLHIIKASGALEHIEFLDVSGNDPSESFAKALIVACGDNGPIFVYNAGFETARIRELAERYPQFGNQLLAINARVVDLLPIARKRYYHPSQQGGWSIKKVLPAVVPELRYDSLDGVQNGGMAMGAFLESIHPDTSAERKVQIEQQLLEYCKLDTYAMVRMWQVFSGRNDLKL